MFIILDFGIGCFNFFINCLKRLWFFVWLMVDNLVFRSLILSLLRILFLDNFMVILRLVCLLSVGSKVFGCFL